MESWVSVTSFRCGVCDVFKALDINIQSIYQYTIRYIIRDVLMEQLYKYIYYIYK